jgi:phage shock protein A
VSAYYKIFKSGKFNSACRRWDEKNEADKTWNNFKIHFAAAFSQHRQMQGETVGAQGYANAAVAQPEDDLAEQAMCAFTNIATATAVARGVVEQLTEANSHLTKQLEDNATALKEIKALLKKERAERANSGNSERPPRRNFTPSSDNYCWSHG